MRLASRCCEIFRLFHHIQKKQRNLSASGFLRLSPDHFVHHAGVGLDDLDHLGGYVFLHIVRHGNPQIAVPVHLNGGVHRLQKILFVNARQNEAALVQRFGALRGRADAHRRERMSHTGEEAAFLRQCTRIRYYSKGVHLQAVVIMEA